MGFSVFFFFSLKLSEVREGCFNTDCLRHLPTIGGYLKWRICPYAVLMKLFISNWYVGTHHVSENCIVLGMFAAALQTKIRR